MNWSLSHLDWEGWGGVKKRKNTKQTAPWNYSEICSAITKWQWETSFTSKVTQGISKALGITYYLHCAWRSQSSGKVERVNQFLNSEIKKITQEKFLGWKETLPIDLLQTHISPKEQLRLSPYEMLYGRPFVYVNDFLLDPEVQTLWSYTMAIGQFQQHIRMWVSTRIQKILKSLHYMLQGLKS